MKEIKAGTKEEKGWIFKIGLLINDNIEDFNKYRIFYLLMRDSKPHVLKYSSRNNLFQI